MTDDEHDAQRRAKANTHAASARRAVAVNVKSGPPPHPVRKAAKSWRENPEWPARDPAGYVFLARAVENIGRVLFGDDWTGDEAPASLPDTSSYPYRRIHSPSESEKATEARFEKVQDTIAAAAESKQLLTAGRPKEGGKMVDLPAQHWNTDDLLPRFHTCQIDPDYPFTSHPDRCPDPHWVFVRLDSLEQFTDGLEQKRAPRGEPQAPEPSHTTAGLEQRSSTARQSEGAGTYWKSTWWIEAEKWPRDPHGWVFLGRAVHRLGKSMFEEGWRGLEPMAWVYSGADELKPFPTLSKHATPSQIRFADHIFTHLRPDLAAGPRPPLTQGSFTPDEWKSVKAYADEYRLVRRNGAARFLELVRLLASEAEAGRLRTGVRPIAGGAVRPLAPEFWNTERLRPRFTMCQLNPADPFSIGHTGEDHCWIFIDEETLERLMAEVKPDKAATTADRRKAVQYLMPVLSEQKPAGVTKASVRQQCMDELGISDRTFRAAWDSIEKHPSWAKAGRPKSSQ